MTIKWTNIIALALVLAAVVVILTVPREIGAFLGTIRYIDGGDPHDEMMGLMAFGLLLLLIVAVVKIAINGDGKR